MSNLRWWDPAGELATTHRMMDRLFDSFVGPGSADPPSAEQLPTYPLPVDIVENESAYLLHASVAGFRPEKVDVTFDEGILTIQAQAEPIVEKGQWLRRERPHGSLIRRLQLPAEVQGDRIQAVFEDGVLSVTVPKAPRPQPLKDPGERRAQGAGFLLHSALTLLAEGEGTTPFPSAIPRFLR
ncbi:MAG: Hsp20/alpha crystallin family protein [Candidatus Dormibacteraeota bacterium]|nr:Hsp20/alpha crystallin family protein [Candidatus Dormibacteraeota bacterium]